MKCHVIPLLTAMSESSKVKVNYFCLGAALIFIGSVLLCTLGFTVVLPYESTRDWPEVMCSVINSTYAADVCSCDDQLNVYDTCVSKYPCLRIHIIYPRYIKALTNDHLLLDISNHRNHSMVKREEDIVLSSLNTADNNTTTIASTFNETNVPHVSTLNDAKTSSISYYNSVEDGHHRIHSFSNSNVTIKSVLLRSVSTDLAVTKENFTHRPSILLNTSDNGAKSPAELHNRNVQGSSFRSSQKFASDRTENTGSVKADIMPRNGAGMRNQKDRPEVDIRNDSNVLNYIESTILTGRHVSRPTTSEQFDSRLRNRTTEYSAEGNISKNESKISSNEVLESIVAPLPIASHNTTNSFVSIYNNFSTTGKYSTMKVLGFDTDYNGNATPTKRNDGISLHSPSPPEGNNPSRSVIHQTQTVDSIAESHGSVVTTQSARLYRSWDDSFNVECSITECGDETWNVKESRRFKSDWGETGQTFPCFYNPSNPEMVIIEKTSRTSAVHAIAWPAVCLSLGILLWIGLCLGCWSFSNELAHKDDYGPLYS